MSNGTINKAIQLVHYLGTNNDISTISTVNNIDNVITIGDDGVSPLSWTNGSLFNSLSSFANNNGYIIYSKNTASFPYNLYDTSDSALTGVIIDKQIQVVQYKGSGTPISSSAIVSNLNAVISIGSDGISPLSWTSGSSFNSLSSFVSGNSYLFFSKDTSVPYTLWGNIVPTPTTGGSFNGTWNTYGGVVNAPVGGGLLSYTTGTTMYHVVSSSSYNQSIASIDELPCNPPGVEVPILYNTHHVSGIYGLVIKKTNNAYTEAWTSYSPLDTFAIKLDTADVYGAYTDGGTYIGTTITPINLSYVNNKYYLYFLAIGNMFYYTDPCNLIQTATYQSKAGYYSSSDGASWTVTTIMDTVGGGNTNIADFYVSYGANRFVMVGNTYFNSDFVFAGFAKSSSDGVNWTDRTIGNYRWHKILYGNNKFVAIDRTNMVSTSASGLLWSTPASVGDIILSDIAFGAGKFVAVGAKTGGGGSVYYSTDGASWSAVSMPVNNAWTFVSYQNGFFFATTSSNGTDIATSSDGINWDLGIMPRSASWTNVAGAAGGIYMANVSNGNLAYSTG